MGTNTETHNQTLHIDLETLSPKWDGMVPANLSPQDSGKSPMEEAEGMEDTKETKPSKLTGSQRLRQHAQGLHRFVLMGS